MTTYNQKRSAVRAAKRAHGGDWASKCVIVEKDGVFLIQNTPTPKPELVKVSSVVQKGETFNIEAPHTEEQAPATVKAQPKLKAVDKPKEATQKATRKPKATPAKVDTVEQPAATVDVVAQLQAGMDALKQTTEAAATVTPANPEKPKAGRKPKALMPIKTNPEKPKATNAPVQIAPAPKRSAGRPISEDQVKVRRKVQAFIETANGEFTVKSLTKHLKAKKMHVSNAVRWAESCGMIQRLGYLDVKRAGRKELRFTRAINAQQAA